MSENPISNVWADFTAETERLRDNGVAGKSGRLRELFDYFAERGPDADSATQAEIAAAVFGQSETDADDATVRVYVHRLRKKLEDHYRTHPRNDGLPMLDLPTGIYALRLIVPESAADAPQPMPSNAPFPRLWIGLAICAVLAAFLGGFLLNRVNAARSNAIFQPLLDSDRPVLVVLGDYYLFGEIDPVRPEEGRLIRDFQVDSAEDLLRLQEADPDRFGYAEDVGLNYLPFQSAYALQQVAPLLAAGDKPVEVIAASELTSEMLTDHDVVYLGLLSGMGLLEEITFAESSLRLGETYDEIIDRESRQIWASDEARRLASPAFYRDFAYIARYEAPGGALVTVVASERVTGLRGIGPIVASGDLSDELEDAASAAGFEALFQITGQQGADLSDRLILARKRD